jgi:hypothetical protein
MEAKVLPQSIILKAIDLLTCKTWTQGALAKDALGKLVSPTSPNAVCWSAEGAILRSSIESMGLAILTIIEVEFVLHSRFPELNKVRLSEWNDYPQRTVSEIKEVFSETAERLASKDEVVNNSKKIIR